MKTTKKNEFFYKKVALGTLMILSFNLLYSQRIISDIELFTHAETVNNLKSTNSEDKNEFFESVILLEDWMVNPSNWDSSSNISEADLSINESEIEFENWMLDPECFGQKREKFEEETLTLEEWMLHPLEIQSDNLNVKQ